MFGSRGLTKDRNLSDYLLWGHEREDQGADKVSPESGVVAAHPVHSQEMEALQDCSGQFSLLPLRIAILGDFANFELE